MTGCGVVLAHRQAFDPHAARSSAHHGLHYGHRGRRPRRAGRDPGRVTAAQGHQAAARLMRAGVGDSRDGPALERGRGCEVEEKSSRTSCQRARRRWHRRSRNATVPALRAGCPDAPRSLAPIRRHRSGGNRAGPSHRSHALGPGPETAIHVHPCRTRGCSPRQVIGRRRQREFCRFRDDLGELPGARNPRGVGSACTRAVSAPSVATSCGTKCGIGRHRRPIPTRPASAR